MATEFQRPAVSNGATPACTSVPCLSFCVHHPVLIGHCAQLQLPLHQIKLPLHPHHIPLCSFVSFVVKRLGFQSPDHPISRSPDLLRPPLPHHPSSSPFWRGFQRFCFPMSAISLLPPPHFTPFHPTHTPCHPTLTPGLKPRLRHSTPLCCIRLRDQAEGRNPKNTKRNGLSVA
jgi:hypothetical protein